MATIVREYFHRDPTAYGEAFIFYNKKYDTVKILHYDLNGYVIYQKWFDDGKMLKPKFMEIKSCHLITREQVTLLVSNAVQSKCIFMINKQKILTLLPLGSKLRRL